LGIGYNNDPGQSKSAGAFFMRATVFSPIRFGSDPIGLDSIGRGDTMSEAFVGMKIMGSIDIWSLTN
jgi:hypothetical protein